VPGTSHFYLSSSSSSSSSSSESTAGSGEKKKEDEALTPERVAELVEVAFVQGVMQLSKGYIDEIKLFIAAVQSGYGLGMSPRKLLDQVAACQNQSANRPLMIEEIELRDLWVQIVYLVLDHVKYNNTEVDIDEVDPVVFEMYAPLIPLLSQCKNNGEVFEAETILQKCISATPQLISISDAMTKAIVSQSIRVIWLTITVLEEEERCIDEKKPVKPQPPIPGAFD